MNKTLYCNSDNTGIVYNAFIHNVKKGMNVNLAAPFFSSSDIIIDLLNHDCTINLLIGLSEATSPDALTKIIDHPKVRIRYYNDTRFHFKLYIFGIESILLGSANLTKSALMSNSEICIRIDSQHECFEDLIAFFNFHWSNAAVLSKEELKKYKENHQANRVVVSKFDNFLNTNMTSKILSDFDDNKRKRDERAICIDDYKRKYQEFLDQYEILSGVYLQFNKRKTLALPVKMEIDRFLSFIRKKYAVGDTYKEARQLLKDRLINNISKHLEEWFNDSETERDKEYTIEELPKKFEIVHNSLSSIANISKLTQNELFEVLYYTHAFHDSYYWHGQVAEQVFWSRTNDKQVKEMLIHRITSPIPVF